MTLPLKPPISGSVRMQIKLLDFLTGLPVPALENVFASPLHFGRFPIPGPPRLASQSYTHRAREYPALLIAWLPADFTPSLVVLRTGERLLRHLDV